MYVNKTDICQFEANYNTSWYSSSLGSISKHFTKDKQSELSLHGTMYDFSVEYSSIKKENILNIHQYLMIKNNIKWSLDLLCYRSP